METKPVGPVIDHNDFEDEHVEAFGEVAVVLLQQADQQGRD